MSEIKNIFSPVLFLIIILCFFLPFFDLTCQNQKIASITGYELITGTTISPPQLYNTASQRESVNPEPFAVIAIIIAFAAFILGFFKKAALAVIAVSFIGAVTLILLSSKISGDIAGRIELQGLSTQWAPGMYIVLILFLGAMLLNLYLLYDNKYRTVDLDLYSQRMKICAHCGMGNDRGNVYCSGCGQMLA
jgi:lysylphosphatidylglycerol synthetase-like protein (DUF2156 family)